MAKQSGSIMLQGTAGGLTFYKMEGSFFVRRASSLTGRQWKERPAFRGSRAAAHCFGLASRLSSRVYRLVPKEAKSGDLYGYLKGWALLLLNEGREEEEVERLLTRYLLLPIHRDSADKEALSDDEKLQQPTELKRKKGQ
jgi:hypothetical protein